MNYIIKIKDNSKKARSIINMLKALQEDYNFIEISEDIENERESMVLKELEARYKSFLKNKSGKEWKNLLKEL
jgi:arsenate reductase-like glutaredoxin family protein